MRARDGSKTRFFLLVLITPATGGALLSVVKGSDENVPKIYIWYLRGFFALPPRCR